MVQRGFKYKLKPTDEQAEAFRQHAGACRAIYNAALFQREVFWRRKNDALHPDGVRFDFASQCRELTKLRAEFDWIAAVTQTCQQQALRDLDKAFKNFFEGRADYPTPRRKFEHESFRFQAREVQVEKLNRNWSKVRLPKIGWIRFRDTRPMQGELLNVTVSLEPLGWHVSFAREIEHEAPSGWAPSVGIDRGCANSIALSTGELGSAPIMEMRVLDRRHKAAQRAASRRKRGSKRYQKARRRAAAVKSKVARIRKDWNHKASERIARIFGVVCIEDLKIKNMTASAKGTVAEPGKKVRQKAGLNRSILEHGWFQFETFLSYKLAAEGGRLVKVDPRNTSRTCNACGCINVRNRESQAVFKCVDCGHEAHADVNAAKNILWAGTRPSVRAKAQGRESRRAAAA